MDTPFTLLNRKLYPAFAEEMRAQGLSSNEYCHCCKRAKDEWENTDAYDLIDAYKVKTTDCSTCRLFSFASLDLIGNAYKLEEPRPQNLMGFKQAYVIVPVEDGKKPEIWLGGKYVEKMSSKTPYEVVALSGNAAKCALMDRKQAELVISVNIRRELWIYNLMIGNEDNLVIASQTGTIIVNRSQWPELKTAFSELQSKDKNKLISTLRSLANGRYGITAKFVQENLQAHPELVALCQTALPAEPNARLFVLDALAGA